MDPEAPDEPSREELESRVEQLEETVSKMLPDRRGVIKGLGAAALGGAAVGASTGGASGQSATGQVGTESEPVDVEAASLAAQSVSTGDESRRLGTPVDLFVVAGQSNALGEPPDGPGPSVKSKETAIEYDFDNDSLIKLQNDVFGNDTGTNEGHAWTAFALRWKALTGRPVAFVAAAEDGSAMTSGADTGGDNWYQDDSLTQTAIDRTSDAFLRLQDAGYDPQFHGVLWAQGERDAYAIDGGNTTKQAYKDEFINDGSATGDSLITTLETATSEPWASHDWGLFIHEIAYDDGDGDTSGFQDIRQAQREIADSNDRVLYASGKQLSFPSRGLMESGGVHYTQAGYNEMGRNAAERIAGGLTSPRYDPQDGPTAIAYNGGTAQTHTTNGGEKLIVRSVDNDDYDIWNTNFDLFRAEWDGEYEIKMWVEWQAPEDQMRSAVELRVNGNRLGDSVARSSEGISGTSTQSGGTLLTTEQFNSGDSIRPHVIKDSASSLDIQTVKDATRVEVRYLGPATA